LAILGGDLITSASLEKLKPGGASIGDDFDAVVHMVGAGPLTSNSKFTSAIFDLNYQTTCNLVRLLEITHKLDSLALLVNFSSLAAMGTPRSHAHPSAPASVILNVPIRTRWNAEFRCDHDDRELTCVVTNLKHGKEERYPELLIDPQNRRSSNWQRKQWWFHTSYNLCEDANVLSLNLPQFKIVLQGLKLSPPAETVVNSSKHVLNVSLRGLPARTAEKVLLVSVPAAFILAGVRFQQQQVQPAG